MTHALRPPPDTGEPVTAHCMIDSRPAFDICTDTGIPVCYDCTTRPGLTGGIDHHLPGTTVMCAHLPIGIAIESIRYHPGIPGDCGLHWPAGQCWCGQFHRDQAVTLEFDPWRLALSTFGPRPARLG